MAKSKIIVHLEARLEDLKARTLETLQKQGRPRVVAQTVFVTAARACGLQATRNIVADLTAVKPLVRAMVADGSLEFHHVEGGTSYYTIPSVDGMTGNTAHQAGGASFEVDPRHIGENSLHLQALQLLAKKVWRVNMPRLEKAKEMNAKGRLFKDGKWIECEPEGEDQDRFKQQTLQIAAVSALFEKQEAVSFDAFCDDRGRFYIRGGFTSPYMGKLGRWLYTADDECTLDHRTSFAQNFALLTGDSMGKHCGVGTAEDCDFWAGMLRKYGVTVKPHSKHREACKAYGMPLFYGAGQSLAAERRDALLQQAVSAGEIDQPQASAIAEALDKVGDQLTAFGEKARAFAQSFVDWGEDPSWITPSGFKACKKYRTHKSIVWNSGENETWAYPKSMTLKVKTRVICTDVKDESDKSVLVATTANILQSLDASIMAMTICSFYEQTGLILAPVHDAYIVPKEYADTLRQCVIDAMRRLADSDQLKILRRELNLPPVKVIVGKARPSSNMRNLDLREMNPLDEE